MRKSRRAKFEVRVGLALVLMMAAHLALVLPTVGLGADKKSAGKTKAGASKETPLDAARKSGGSKTTTGRRTTKPPATGKAIEVTPKSFRAMEKDGRLTPTSAARDAEGATENRALGEAMGALLVEQLGKKKLVDRYMVAPAGDSKRFRRTDAGNYVTELKTRDGRAESVVLLGGSFATRDLSETLAELGRSTTPGHNYAVVYEGISGLLAKDPAALGVILKGMPEPGKLGRKNPDKLLRDIVRRWNKNWPTKIHPIAGKSNCSENCNKLVDPRQLAGGKQAAACFAKKSSTGLWATADWALKGKSTCVKDQGETRGTGVAFAVSAAVEAAVRREHDVCPDLSEQHVHYQQKNHYFPIPPNFGDDLNAPSSVLGMMVGDYEFRTEDQWIYNLSPERQEVTLKAARTGVVHGYQNSCTGYSDTPCSDTNHQGALLCQKGGNKCGYGAQIPPSKDGIKVLAYNTFFDVASPSQSVEIAPVFLAFGLPIVSSFQVTQAFLDAADDGWVTPASGGKKKQQKVDPLRGWHVAMIEGYVRNQDLAKGTSPAAGGGYFVLKNSWGPCVGDGGYWYVPAQYMVDHALSMTAVTGIEAYGESSVVSLAFNMALEPPVPPTLVTPNFSVMRAGHSILQWTDSNPTSTSYTVCIREAASSSQGSTECTMYPVPAAEAAQKIFRINGSTAFGGENRGRQRYWTVSACNASGCEWAATNQGTAQNRIIRFALPNPMLLGPAPGFAATSRNPPFQWYRLAKDVDANGNWIYDDEVEKYYVTVGPSPMPAPNPPTADEGFKRYETNGTPSTINGLQVLTFFPPDSDPIPDDLGGYVHWYVEACKTIEGAEVCSRFPYWFNRPTPFEETMYFGSLDLPGGDAPGDTGEMTFVQACDIIRDLVDHPRCRNCHNDLEAVTRYDTMQPHGLDGSLACAVCHKPDSVDAPWPGDGEPVWHQPDDVGMHWTGLTPDQIIANIANPATNGSRSLAQIATHVVTDHLILWTFNPVSGTGNLNDRTPAPHPDVYGQAFNVWADQWVANGQSCN